MMTMTPVCTVVLIVSFTIQCIRCFHDYQYRMLPETNASNVSNTSIGVSFSRPLIPRIDPIFINENIRFIEAESNGTRMKLLVSTNNFTKISDLRWIAQLQGIRNTELIPFSDHKIEIISDTETIGLLFRNEAGLAPSEIVISDESELSERIGMIDRSSEQIIDEMDSQSELLPDTWRSPGMPSAERHPTHVIRHFRRNQSRSERVIAALTATMHDISDFIRSHFCDGVKISFLIFLLFMFGIKNK